MYQIGMINTKEIIENEHIRLEFEFTLVSMHRNKYLGELES